MVLRRLRRLVQGGRPIQSRRRAPGETGERALAAAALAALVASSFTLGGCAITLGQSSATEDKPKQYPPFQRNPELERQLIAQIKPPIDYSDAAKIANYYLKHYAKGTMLPASQVDDDRYWKVQLMSYTTGAMLDGYLRIDKQTGGVSGVSPSVRDIPDLLSK